MTSLSSTGFQCHTSPATLVRIHSTNQRVGFFELLTTVPMMPCLSQIYTYLVNWYPSSDNANSNDL
jgi:hypothetical protein